MYVSVLFDIEDIVSPDADDAALDVARVLEEEGIRATHCIVGERARQWRDRGRTDVIEALARHDIAFHTDLHSVHPTVAEYLSERGWSDGVEEAVRRERPGVEALQEVFETMPSAWGGPGNTWGPQLNAAMARLGVPAVLYTLTTVPGGEPHRFCDVLCYPHRRALRDDLLHDDHAWAAQMQQLLADLEQDLARGVFWTDLFAGHPTRMMHTAFWDAANFGGGRNPPRAQWRPAPRKSAAEYSTALRNLGRSLAMVRALPGVRFRTIREMNSLLQERTFAPLSPDRRASVWPAIERNILGMAEWPILPEGFDAAPLARLTWERLDELCELEA